MSGFIGGWNAGGGGGTGGGSPGPTGPTGAPGPTGYHGPTGPIGPTGTGAGELTSIYACVSTVAVLDIVYLRSDDIIDKADATDVHKAAIGIVESKTSSTVAKISYNGEVTGLSGLTPGAIYYLSEVPGQITITPPNDQGSIVQILGFAKDSTTLMVEIDGSFVLL